jgi:hypothetical protein
VNTHTPGRRVARALLLIMPSRPGSCNLRASRRSRCQDGKGGPNNRAGARSMMISYQVKCLSCGRCKWRKQVSGIPLASKAANERLHARMRMQAERQRRSRSRSCAESITCSPVHLFTDHHDHGKPEPSRSGEESTRRSCGLCEGETMLRVVPGQSHTTRRSSYGWTHDRRKSQRGVKLARVPSPWPRAARMQHDPPGDGVNGMYSRWV